MDIIIPVHSAGITSLSLILVDRQVSVPTIGGRVLSDIFFRQTIILLSGQLEVLLPSDAGAIWYSTICPCLIINFSSQLALQRFQRFLFNSPSLVIKGQGRYKCLSIFY